MTQAPPASGLSAATLDALLSTRGKDLPPPRIGDPRKSADLISFMSGFPDPASLPAQQVAEATARAMEKDGRWALQYGATMGYTGLVDALLDKLGRHQGIRAGRENVLITAGGSQAVALTLDLLVDPGDTVLMEEPTWMGFVYALNNLGAKSVGVPVDEHGTDVEALERELKRLTAEGVRPKLIYVIPNFQNPSGVSTTLARRKRIVELAHEYGTLILEDDAYYDLRYEGEWLPPIYTLDEGGQTLYLGTFSKIMGAGMRLGWLVAPPAIIGKLATLKIDGGTNVFGSHVAAEWVPRHLDDHIAKLREIYRRRRDLMLASLARHMPEGTTWTTPEGGFFIWVTFPEGVDTVKMLPQARERGVEFLPGRTCYAQDRGHRFLRLSYSFAEDEQIDDGIRIVGEIARGELLETGRA